MIISLMRLIPEVPTRTLRLTHPPGRRPVPLLCLAPHGVFRAPFLAVRAVGSYPAISPLPSDKRRAVYFLRHFPSNTVFTALSRAFYTACCHLVSGLSSRLRLAPRPSDHPQDLCHTVRSKRKNQSLEPAVAVGTSCAFDRGVGNFVSDPEPYCL